MTQDTQTAQKMIEMFTYKISSTLSIEEITPKMIAACEQFKFSLLHTYDYFQILEGKGFPIERKVYIYEVCQAKMASKVLTNNPEFSIFMPCKIAVYQNENSTVVSTMNLELMLKAFEENKELYQEAVSMFNALKELMHSLIN